MRDAPGDARTLLPARRLLAAGRHDEAAAACAAAVRGPQPAAALELRATALRNAGRHEEARADLEKLARLFPKDSGRWAALGEGARHCQDFAGAERGARRALALSPGDGGALDPGRRPLAKRR